MNWLNESLTSKRRKPNSPLVLDANGMSLYITPNGYPNFTHSVHNFQNFSSNYFQVGLACWQKVPPYTLNKIHKKSIWQRVINYLQTIFDGVYKKSFGPWSFEVKTNWTVWSRLLYIYPNSNQSDGSRK